MPGMADAVLGAHDEHVAAVAVGDDLVLQVLRRVLAAQVRLERAPQARPLLAQAVAHRLQLGAGVVDHLAGRLDLVPRLGDLAAERRPAFGQGLRAAETACAVRRMARAGGLDRLEELGQAEQPQRLERAALDGQGAEDGRQVGRGATGRSPPTSSLNRTPSEVAASSCGHLPRIGSTAAGPPGARRRAA